MLSAGSNLQSHTGVWSVIEGIHIWPDGGKKKNGATKLYTVYVLYEIVCRRSKKKVFTLKLCILMTYFR